MEALSKQWRTVAIACGCAGLWAGSNLPVSAADLFVAPPASRQSCYVAVNLPAEYEIVKERILVAPALASTRYIPPVYGIRNHRVLIEPEKEIWRIVPAKYKKVRRRVLIEPARKVNQVQSRIRQGTRRRILISPEKFTFEWRLINGVRTWCRVRHKAIYNDVAVYQTLRPESVIQKTIPARYVIQETDVVVIAERRVKHTRPARYRDVAERVVIEPEQKIPSSSSAIYETVAREVLVKPARTVWRQIPGGC